MLGDQYAIVISYSEQDEGFLADIPDFEYCTAFGSSPEEALKEILIARKAWIETLLEDGLPLPPVQFGRASTQPNNKNSPAELEVVEGRSGAVEMDTDNQPARVEIGPAKRKVD